ncbi:RNase A-like domain-containing protein [Thermovibrio ammonificans]|jgi:hypothetical protein|uniref:Bacterial CdiA-CT RNAse A domain-containing protein n=1 Tax=Thermovibrio ammonificans (strain DSM 15698 / JCM 12110 / HB-1) TaxID=648996 RepID=E8T3E5_THEA1|nr:RNase A-like domain-containing protein [Thermovibrio ammonificans]ADU97277.1 hypothetical protein Theam_1314 [Thermovibrio ammonificans HB-1]
MKKLLTFLLVLLLPLLSLTGCLQEKPQEPKVNHAALKELGYRGLAFYERHGGHTIRKHVGKTGSWLKERLKREERLKSASTFYDLKTAERVVEAAISQNREKILRWLKNPNAPNKLVITYRGSKPIGFKVTRVQKGVFEESTCTDARVILKKDGRFGYIVLTAYPI